jgi:hypothetical protein
VFKNPVGIKDYGGRGRGSARKMINVKKGWGKKRKSGRGSRWCL